MICLHCSQEFRQGEKPYRSRQAGMKGLYHWKCFVAACHEVNEQGENTLKATLSEKELYGEGEHGHIIDLGGTQALLN